MLAAKICAIVIFLLMFGAIITEVLERHITTLVAGLTTMVVVFGICMHSVDAIIKTLN